MRTKLEFHSRTARLSVSLPILFIPILAACAAPATPAASSPQAWIDAPLEGSSLPLGPIDVLAHGADPGGVSQMELTINGRPEGSPSLPEGGTSLVHVTWNWDPPGPGSYMLQVRSRDLAGTWSPPAQARIDIVGEAQTSLGACIFTADQVTPFYQRPGLSAEVFFTAQPGETVQPLARTADGWLGFDPGIAQAANVGPFRLRWIAPDATVLGGDCASLPIMWGPPPGVCFFMPMADSNLHEQPDAGSALVTTIHEDEFAAVDDAMPDGWIHVDLAAGNTGQSHTGWVAPQEVNWNGACEGFPSEVPTPTPQPSSAASIEIVRVSSDALYLNGVSCTPKEVTIVAQAQDPDGIQVVVLFYQLRNEENGNLTDFYSLAMSPIGGDLYQAVFNKDAPFGGVNLSDFVSDSDFGLEYQAVIQDLTGDTSVRTPLLSDITLAMCLE